MFRTIAFAVLCFIFYGAAPARAYAAAPPNTNWTRVEALRTGTKIRLTMDRGSKTCHIYSVTDDSLTCASGNSAGQVVPRAEIKKIVVHHYLRSTMSGLAIGVAAGAITGYAVGRSDSCAAKTNCWDIVGPGAVAAVGAVAFGLAGTAIGGATDFTRGGAIYVRP